MSFSKRLKEVMDEKGFTNYRVAKDLGMSATTISNYLNNKTRPDTTKLEVLSLSLGVNRNWLLTGEGDKYRKEAIPVGNRTEEVLVREDNFAVTQHLFSIIDKQAGSMKAKDEQLGKLIETNEMLLNKLTPLLEKLIERL